MSVEAAIFVLRLLAGMSLIAFLITLMAIIWRGLRQLDRQLADERRALGYLTLQNSDPGERESAVARFPVYANTTIGRSADSAMIVDDEDASDRHARVILEEGRWWLEDRSGSGGTRLNDVVIDQPTVLGDGDVIGIGKRSYRLTLERDPP